MGWGTGHRRIPAAVSGCGQVWSEMYLLLRQRGWWWEISPVTGGSIVADNRRERLTSEGAESAVEGGAGEAGVK